MIFTIYLKHCSKHLCYRRFKHNWIQPEGHDTNIKVYNCITKSKVPLIFRNKERASWYTCGPTVYDLAHIGHASCYVKLDIIQRILRHHFNMNLITAMNITDIDDKIINRSKQLSVVATELARRYENEFWTDLQDLNVLKPDIIVRVTDHIPVITRLIRRLIDDRRAYVVTDGSVYFDLQKCAASYGKLEPAVTDNQVNGDGLKKSSGDFALWKGSKPGEPSWAADFGTGRPGWHTECSALASAIFGNSVDIHAGGIDLRFPHHENEEAISCAHHGCGQWVNYWLHTGHLNLPGGSAKMSKSLGNCVSIRDILNQSKIAADSFRMACAMSHYRAGMEYSDELMSTAEAQLNKFKSFLTECDVFVSQSQYVIDSYHLCALESKIAKAKCDITEALRDDFNTAKVIRIITELVGTTNKLLRDTMWSSGGNLSNQSSRSLSGSVVVASLANFLREQCSILGFTSAFTGRERLDNVDRSAENILEVLVMFRQNIRNVGLQNKDGALLQYCDALRDELKMYGIEVKDRGKMSSWNKT